MTYTNPETKEAFDNILNVFGGGDNGKFINLMIGIRLLDKEDSEKSRLIIDIMIKFSNLINVLNEITEDK